MGKKIHANIVYIRVYIKKHINVIIQLTTCRIVLLCKSVSVYRQMKRCSVMCAYISRRICTTCL